MKIKQAELIADLQNRTKQVIEDATALQKLALADLNQKPTPESWSALECIEHLNRYGHFYIPEITKRLTAAPSGNKDTTYASSWLGNFLAESLLPSKGGKMKTFKVMNPINSQLSKESIAEFLSQQKEILLLLETAKVVDMKKVKTSISISKIIKIRLGDTFRTVIYHNQRHLLQASKTAFLKR
jgi:hypothetical protein